jgi:nucleotide-binding universal stress UspA family protein
MVKKILVPLAFSKYSKGILNFAAELAGVTGAELIVVNVINERDLEAIDKISSFGYKVDVDHYIQTVKKERREELEKLMAGLTLPDDKVTYTFSIGEPTSELLKLVVDREIDMVVMGMKDKELSHIFTGSVAERMFRRCPVPIVSYREDEIAERLRRRFEKSRSRDE